MNHVHNFFWNDLYYRKLECRICGLNIGETEILKKVNAHEKEKCICVDLLNGNPDPVPNPDCPIHGSMK